MVVMDRDRDGYCSVVKKEWGFLLFYQERGGRDYPKQQIQWASLIWITFCINTIYQGAATNQAPQ